MFGLSLQKILVLVGVILAVWAFFGYAKRLKQQRDEIAKAKARLAQQQRAAPPRQRAAAATAELQACPVCGTYADLATHRCGRS